MTMANLNHMFLNIVWSELQSNFDEGCLKFGISRDVGETIRAMQFVELMSIANTHDQIPLFEMRFKESSTFWRTAADNASKDADSQWSKVVRHFALLMVAPPDGPDVAKHGKPQIATVR